MRALQRFNTEWEATIHMSWCGSVRMSPTSWFTYYESVSEKSQQWVISIKCRQNEITTALMKSPALYPLSKWTMNRLNETP